MKLPPLRHSLVFWILLGYAGLLFAHLAAATFPAGDRSRERRGFELEHVLRVCRPLLKEGHERELLKYLRDARVTGFVDFFEVQFKSRTEQNGIAPLPIPPLPDAVNEIDGWLWGKAESADVTLRLASGFGWRTRLRQAWAGELTRLPADLAYLLFACALGLLFQGRARRQAAEGAVEADLRREGRRARSRPEAVRRASEGGEFLGTCGRSSLLNAADLAGKGDAEKFFASLEEFFADCAALVERYRGKLHGVYGHELLFSISEKDPVTEARLALAAARDLEALARLRGIRLGTALSRGRLHAAHLASGFALFGAPVEETADICQALTAHTGEGGAIWVTEEIAGLASKHANFRAPAAGRKMHARALAELPDAAQALLGARRTGDFTELAFHRGDAALEHFLRSFAEDPGWEKEAYVGAINALRLIPCRRCAESVVHAYRDLLGAELEKKESYRLSSAVALGTTLLSRAQVDRPLEKLFLQAIAVKDRRVRANTVELFTRFFPEREVPELRSLLRDEDNRVSANALIKAACERFDEKVIVRIEERVRGGSVAHVASALHAMGEIAHYYRKHDPLYLGSKISFLRLFDGVPDWAMHPNSMIRRQALIAAHKLRSDPLDARLRELFAVSDDAELLELFASVYGWRKDRHGKAVA